MFPRELERNFHCDRKFTRSKVITPRTHRPSPADNFSTLNTTLDWYLKAPSNSFTAPSQRCRSMAWVLTAVLGVKRWCYRKTGRFNVRHQSFIGTALAPAMEKLIYKASLGKFETSSAQPAKTQKQRCSRSRKSSRHSRLLYEKTFKFAKCNFQMVKIFSLFVGDLA